MKENGRTPLEARPPDKDKIEEVDAVSLYLGDIGSSELLTREQELVMGRGVQEAKKKLADIRTGLGITKGETTLYLLQKMANLDQKQVKMTPAYRALLIAECETLDQQAYEEQQGEKSLLHDLTERPAPKEITLSPQEKAQITLVARYRKKELEKLKANPEHREAEEEFIQRRNEFAEANLRLVVFIARKYKSEQLDFLDLVNEGNIGLLRAVENFDPKKEKKFSTYATYWIKVFIRRALLEHATGIRFSQQKWENISKVKHIKHALSLQFEREPTVEEIAIATGFSVQIIEDLEASEQLEIEYLSKRKDQQNANSTIEEDLASETSVEEEAIDNQRRKKIKEVLNGLSEQEQDVVKMRFGIPTGKIYTLAEVGKKYELTRERIRQIEGEALEKIREKIDELRLKDF